jgi:hypothetical protein
MPRSNGEGQAGSDAPAGHDASKGERDVGLARPRRFFRGIVLNEHSPPLAMVTLCVLIVNVPTLLHIVTNNPLQIDAVLQSGNTHQLLPGVPSIDPNAGYITQSLGRLSATTWLHGHIPWWNPFEGIGSPLAGEMQSAAFFPLTLLFDGGWWGFVLFHLALELVAGWATYFLLRRLRIGRLGATSGAVAFGLCGTFAWFSHAPANVVAFLPLTLLGVERCLSAARQQRIGGWALVALALALSALAGFPEGAYLDGLFAVVWMGARFVTAGRARARLFVNLVTGGVVGALLSAPILVAFATYLPHADIGVHASSVANAALPPRALATVILPYVYGPIFAFHSTDSLTLTVIWGNVGGYVTAALVVCALVGLVGRRLRLLRAALALWIFLALAKSYGLDPLARWISHIPGLQHTATYRYSPISWEMAVVVLAALGIDDATKSRVRTWVPPAAAAVTAVLVAAAMAAAWPVVTHSAGNPGTSSVGTAHRHVYDLASGVWALFTLAVVSTCLFLAARQGGADGNHGGRPRRRRGAVAVAAGVVMLDVVLMFATPLLSAPAPQPVDLAVVQFLQRNLGLHRFATLGPLQPNYGSYFDIAQVNVNDVPVPTLYAHYISHHLDDNVNPLNFTGAVRQDPAAASAGTELTDHLASYEEIGVKYVVEFASGLDSTGHVWPPPQLSTVKLVYADDLTRVYQLPDPAPVFATSGVRCAVTPGGWDAATVACPHPALLVHRELSIPGWSATVANRPVPVTTADGIFQAVAVPAGVSTVRFTFAPPHVVWAYSAFFVGLALLVAGGGWELWRRAGRDRRRRSKAPTKGGDDPASPPVSRAEPIWSVHAPS